MRRPEMPLSDKRLMSFRGGITTSPISGARFGREQPWSGRLRASEYRKERGTLPCAEVQESWSQTVRVSGDLPRGCDIERCPPLS